jgi:Uma2 family endonuclease
MEPMPDLGLLEPDALAPERIHPLRFDEYRTLDEAGAFEGHKVELLDGVVVEMMSQGPVHANLIVALNRVLARRLLDNYRVAPQCTNKLTDYDAPEPDFAIVTTSSFQRRPIDYPQSVWMIEVAITSQRKDRGIKARLYASVGIPEYWVVDGEAMVIDVFRDPAPDGYRMHVRHDRTASIAPLIMPDLVMSLDDLLEDRVPV